jgi:hypothetical protein
VLGRWAQHPSVRSWSSLPACLIRCYCSTVSYIATGLILQSKNNLRRCISSVADCVTAAIETATGRLTTSCSPPEQLSSLCMEHCWLGDPCPPKPMLIGRFKQVVALGGLREPALAAGGWHLCLCHPHSWHLITLLDNDVVSCVSICTYLLNNWTG